MTGGQKVVLKLRVRDNLTQMFDHELLQVANFIVRNVTDETTTDGDCLWQMYKWMKSNDLLVKLPGEPARSPMHPALGLCTGCGRGDAHTEVDCLQAQVDSYREYINIIQLNVPDKYRSQPQLDLCMQRMKEAIQRLDPEGKDQPV